MRGECEIELEMERCSNKETIALKHGNPVSGIYWQSRMRAMSWVLNKEN